MEEKERIALLFDRYFRKETTPAEEEELMGVISNGRYKDLFQNQIDQFLLHEPVMEEYSSARAQVIKDRIFSSTKQEAKRIMLAPLKWIAAAAVLVIAATAGIWLYTHPTAKLELLTSEEVQPQSVKTIFFKGPDFIRLPDNTTVLLTANSSLTYQSSYGDNNREVTLDGQGFFDVTHNPSKEFRVLTGDVVTTVLGTAFNINTHVGTKNFASIEVTVSRGKVKVADQNRELGIITPNQQIAVNTLDHTFSKRTVMLSEVEAWKDEYVILANATLEEAAEKISKRYKVPITVSESMKRCRITIDFFPDTKLETALEVLSGVGNGTYTREQSGLIVIDGKGCQ